MITASAINFSSAPEKDGTIGLFSCEESGPLDVLPSPALRKKLLASAQAESFKSGLGECVALNAATQGKRRRYLLVGVGKKSELTAETARRAAAALCHFAKKRCASLAALPPEGYAQAVAEGLALASYRFDEYRKEESRPLQSLRVAYARPENRRRVENACAKAALYCEAVATVRNLVNRGPSDKTPQGLADMARGLTDPYVSVSIINREAAAELGMGAFLGVARGSAVEPMFIHLVYKPKGARKKIALIGKGITFDSGGLSLKPPASMETMKMDMAGAAAVLGVFKVLPRLKVRAEVHGFCAVTYNMPGPDALKPGDIVRAMNGKTIEVLNTDAEGRLVLADALVYACRQKPDAIIDLATLTGAVVVALGSKVAGAMSNDKALLRQITAAAEAVDEPICELPLVRDYKEEIKSPIADLQNIGKARGEAGSIIGGLFLEEFVDSTPWVHLDIAGTAWSGGEKFYWSKGGTGSGVRTILEYLGSL